MTLDEHMLSWQEKHVRLSNGKILCEDQEKENRGQQQTLAGTSEHFIFPEAQELGPRTGGM